MPRGDGQGGNNGQGEERGPRSADEILLAKIKLHEQAAAGEIDSREPREFHVFAAEQVRAELAELVERGAGMLEAMQGHGRLREVLRGEPQQIAVAQLDLCDRTINGLESHGVLWASELAEWTGKRVLSVPMFGAAVATEIRMALAEVGLRLRDDIREKDPAAVALGRKGGLKGGKARAANMTAAQRTDAARKAAKARWNGHA